MSHANCLLLLFAERVKVLVIQGDITDPISVLEASRGADLLIHTASLVDVWHRVPQQVIYAVNVTGGSRFKEKSMGLASL